MRRRTWRAICALALVASLACSLIPVKIKEIKKSPDRFENRSVTIRGKVSSGTRLPFMTQAFYEVDDGSGSIMVITRKAIPPDGDTVFVRGKVESAFKIGGQTYGTVVKEE
jgi:hypothetical protein